MKPITKEEYDNLSEEDKIIARLRGYDGGIEESKQAVRRLYELLGILDSGNM